MRQKSGGYYESIEKEKAIGSTDGSLFAERNCPRKPTGRGIKGQSGDVIYCCRVGYERVFSVWLGDKL